MSAEDFFDAPETPGAKSKWQQWGYYYFRDGLQNAKVEFLEPNKEEPSIVRVAGRPVLDSAGNVIDIQPFLRPRPSRRLSDPTERLMHPTVCYQARVVRYSGPRPEMDEDNRRMGAPQLHFIDEYPPHVRRKYVSEGRQLPPTCMDILLARAPSVASRNSKYQKYYKPDDDFHSSLRRPTNIWFLNGLCLNHGKVDCSVETPLACLHLLTWTAYKSMLDLVLAERDGYTYPEGITHESAGSRAELARRFTCPDLTDPAGAPALVFTQHKQKRKSVKGSKGERGNIEGNRYVATLTDIQYPFPAELQARMWTAPEDLFWYPTPAEAFRLMLENASEQDWQDFLLALAKGTDLEPVAAERGFSASAAVNSRQPAESDGGNGDADYDAGAPEDGEYEEEAQAAPRSAQAGPAQGFGAAEARPAAPAAPRPAQAGAVQALGLGADFGKPRQAVRAGNTDDIALPANMPLPDVGKVFGSGAAGAAADLPESVEERTKAALGRLAQIRGTLGPK